MLTTYMDMIVRDYVKGLGHQVDQILSLDISKYGDLSHYIYLLYLEHVFEEHAFVLVESRSSSLALTEFPRYPTSNYSSGFRWIITSHLGPRELHQWDLGPFTLGRGFDKVRCDLIIKLADKHGALTIYPLT